MQLQWIETRKDVYHYRLGNLTVSVVYFFHDHYGIVYFIPNDTETALTKTDTLKGAKECVEYQFNILLEAVKAIN